MRMRLLLCVVAGLVPAIHVFLSPSRCEDVDSRNRSGHDGSTFNLLAQVYYNATQSILRSLTVRANSTT